MPKDGKMISIVMPAKNEEENLPRAYQAVTDVMAGLGDYRYEVIVIDNDSKDATEDICNSICERDAHWKYIRFSRDFTAEVSVTAGMRFASGDYVIILASDLQEPPEMLPVFIERAEQGFDIVAGKLDKRADDAWWKTLGAKLVYWILRKFSDVNIPENLTDLKLMSRPVVDAINAFDERNRYLRGIVKTAGFKMTTVSYKRNPRIAGESHAPFFYLIDFAIRALTSHSMMPLRLFSLTGLAVGAMAILYSVIVLIQFFLGGSIPGLTTIYILLLFGIAISAMGFGVIGEYIGRIYLETKQRPLWVIKSTKNIEIPLKNRIGP